MILSLTLPLHVYPSDGSIISQSRRMALSWAANQQVCLCGVSVRPKLPLVALNLVAYEVTVRFYPPPDGRKIVAHPGHTHLGVRLPRGEMAQA